MPQHGRIAELDILRTIAIVLVLGRHLPDPPDHLPGIVFWPLYHWRVGGWVGVDIFFVLSGFLVSGLLFREYQQFQRIQVQRFLIRRGLKIYPAFYFFILASLILAPQFETPAFDFTAVLGELFFIQNYLGGIWYHTWSLAVEEHFYILLSLLCYRLSSRGRLGSIAVVWICASIAVLCLLLRCISAYSDFMPLSRIMYLSHLRIDSLVYGVLLSYWYHFHPRKVEALLRPRIAVLAISGVSILSLAFMFQPTRSIFIQTLGFTLFYLAAGNCLLAFLFWNSARKVQLLSRFSLLATLGTYSYSIYLWHMPIQYWLVPRLVPYFAVEYSYLAVQSIYFISSFLFGVLAAKAVEFPVVRVRDRFFPSRSGIVKKLKDT